MFVKTPEPKPIGTLVQFEFSVGEQELIQGLGDVVWIRLKESAAGKPRGMGIQFRYVDPQSRDLIYRIVSRYLEERKAADDGGGDTAGEAAAPFELGPAPAVTAGASEEALPSIDELVLEPTERRRSPMPAQPAQPAQPAPPSPAPPSPAPSSPAPSVPSVEVPPIEIPDLDPPVPSSEEPGSRPAPSPAGPPVAPASAPPSAPSPASPEDVGTSPEDVGTSPEDVDGASTVAAPRPAPQPETPPAPPQAPPAAKPVAEPEPVFDFQPQVELPEEEPTVGGPGATVSPFAKPPVSPEASAFEAVFGSADEADATPGSALSPFKPPSATAGKASPRRSRLGLWLALLLLVVVAAAGWTFRGELPDLLERGKAAVGLGSSEEGAQESPAPAPPAGAPATVTDESTTGTEVAGQTPGPLDVPPADSGGESGSPGPSDGGESPETTATGGQLPPPSGAPVDVAETSPPDEEAPSPQASPATPPTRLTGIVARDGSDSSAIVLTGDRPFAAGSFSTLALQSPPRFVVKLQGIGQLPNRSPVSSRLLGMRSGVHGQAGSRELHLVFDLAREDLRPTARLRRRHDRGSSTGRLAGPR